MFNASESVPPLGDPIDTIAHRNGQLGVEIQRSIGTEFLAANPSRALQLVVIDRTPDGQPATSQTFTNDAQGAQQLATAVGQLPDSDLVIVTKPDPTVSEAGDSATAAAQALTGALKQIGVTPPPADVLTDAGPCDSSRPCSTFSAIGVPGTTAGGTINPGLGSSGTAADDGSPPAPGNLHGELALDSQGNFTFVNRESVTFDSDDTDKPSTSTQATVSIGGSRYSSQPLQPGQAGFYVLVLNAGDLSVLKQGTFAESTQMGAMQALLAAWSSDPAALVMIQSIGAVGRDVTPDRAAWDQVAQQISALGASDKYFESLNSQHDNEYAQIGVGGAGSVLGAQSYPSPWTQVASIDRSGTGRITGLLARDPASQFYPDESRLPDQPLGGTLTGLISEEPATDPVTGVTGWPDRAGGPGNAMACIAANMTPKLPLPIQSSYPNTNIDWGARSGQLDNMTAAGLRQADPADCQSPSGFSDADFAVAKTELLGNGARSGICGTGSPT